LSCFADERPEILKCNKNARARNARNARAEPFGDVLVDVTVVVWYSSPFSESRYFRNSTVEHKSLILEYFCQEKFLVWKWGYLSGLFIYRLRAVPLLFENNNAN